jgi:hypothetical protein
MTPQWIAGSGNDLTADAGRLFSPSRAAKSSILAWKSYVLRHFAAAYRLTLTNRDYRCAHEALGKIPILVQADRARRGGPCDVGSFLAGLAAFLGVLGALPRR